MHAVFWIENRKRAMRRSSYSQQMLLRRRTERLTTGPSEPLNAHIPSSKRNDIRAETETPCNKETCCQCWPRPVQQQTTPLQGVSVPSRRDASQIQVRCVSGSRPTRVSQGFRRLALLGSETAPLGLSYLKMVLISPSQLPSHSATLQYF